jgi:hypothetical protein
LVQDGIEDLKDYTLKTIIWKEENQHKT